MRKSTTLSAIAACLSIALIATCVADGPGSPEEAGAPALPDLYGHGLLSTADYELNAAFSPSGDTLLFTRSAFGHWWMTVFMTMREGDGWSPPQVAPFSGRYSDADAVYSPDGSAVYFISDRPLESERTDGAFNIWRVHVQEDGFGEPTPLPEPIRSEGDEYFPAVARSGALYFSAVREGAIGGYDLFRAEPDGEGWMDPVVLPATVNQPGSEIDVVVDPDERFLVFAAYGRDDSLGGGDLYVTFRTAEGWTEAENLGSPVNSGAREYAPGLSSDGEYLYVTSERTRYTKGEVALNAQDWEDLMHGPGNGMGDVYRYRIAELPVFQDRAW